MLRLQVILSNLVYEKQQKLRTIMKMHGLGDVAYWTISYCYFLLLSLLYMLILIVFGKGTGKRCASLIFQINKDINVKLVRVAQVVDNTHTFVWFCFLLIESCFRLVQTLLG